MTGSQPNRQLLAEIYASSTDIDVKRQILRVVHDGRRPGSACWRRPPAKSRRSCVGGRAQLGMMGARDELWQLYQKESSSTSSSRCCRA